MPAVNGPDHSSLDSSLQGILIPLTTALHMFRASVKGATSVGPSIDAQVSDQPGVAARNLFMLLIDGWQENIPPSGSVGALSTEW